MTLFVDYGYADHRAVFVFQQQFQQSGICGTGFTRKIPLEDCFLPLPNPNTAIPFALNEAAIQTTEADRVDALSLAKLDKTTVAKARIGHHDEVYGLLVRINTGIARQRSQLLFGH